MRSSVSGRNRCRRALLKGRCGGSMEKQDVAFVEGSRQAHGYGLTKGLLPLSWKCRRLLRGSLSEVGRLSRLWGDVPMGILSCL